ncbi:MAG: flagellar export chaperone FliS [Planctomycetaceae bacterium]|jgi:flagellar protein FliS|nr:flagellar export chaperone FliS [Planctomycetaceae bacterium]
MMQPRQSIRHNYLQAEVHTATPQKLQLLLVEAAIKNIHRTKQFWKDQKYDDGIESLSRAQDIIAEILCSLDREGSPDIAKKLASIYLFIFRRLAESGMSHDEQKLDDALRVLNSERETWRLVCEKFGTTISPANQSPNEGTKLDLSTRVPPQQTASGNTTSGKSTATLGNSTSGKSTATFTRPSFIQGVRPLGMASGIQSGIQGGIQSGIQTDSSLAGATAAKTGGAGIGTGGVGAKPPATTTPANDSQQSAQTTVSTSGNTWDA